MICIDVKLNGDRLCCAAIPDALLLTPSIAAWVGGNAPAQLDVRGMCELTGNRNAHVDWSEFTELYAGDSVQFTLGNTSARQRR